MGSLGAWWLGEALAGGSGELRDQVAADKAAKKRGEDPERRRFDFEDISHRRRRLRRRVRRRNRQKNYQKRTTDILSNHAHGRHPQSQGRASEITSRGESRRCEARESGTPRVRRLSIDGDGTDLLGITALCSACERTKRLTSLDLANNALSDEAVRSLANALDRSNPRL